jgi:PAS domain S-box-containing protein
MPFGYSVNEVQMRQRRQLWMKDESKTKKQLIDELNEMRHMLAEYRKSAGEELLGKRYCCVIDTAYDDIEKLDQHDDITDIPQHIQTENERKTYQQQLEELVERRTEELIKTNQELQNEITNRKWTEDALRKSEEKFFKAFHFSPDPFTILNLKDGCYVEVNDAFLKSTGYNQEETIGYTADYLGIWVDPEEREQIIRQIREQGSIGNMETKFRNKSGEIRTTLLSAFIIDMDGEPHLFLLNKDITERKKMEEALCLSEERFSKAFKASLCTMTITSLKDGHFLDINDNFCHIVGYTRDEILGLTSLELGFWVDRADRDLILRSIKNKHPVHDLEITFHRRRSEQRRGLYSAEEIDINGEPCILSIITDITELRKMEVELTRLDRLNLVGEMAASIGHEIRNPMTTVRGYLQLLRENQNYHKEIEFFDLMIEEVDRANSIITEYLSLAKDKMVEMKSSNLNEIINKLVPLIEVKAIGRDQYIKLELADVPDLILDNEEIRQLILNLVDNGLDSMPSQGCVTLKTFIKDKHVVLAVQDHGHGIDHELLDKLGTPFFTTKEQGTGLGLAVCYRIATRHNAKISIETSSSGSTFYVRFSIPTGIQ